LLNTTSKFQVKELNLKTKKILIYKSNYNIYKQILLRSAKGYIFNIKDQKPYNSSYRFLIKNRARL